MKRTLVLAFALAVAACSGAQGPDPELDAGIPMGNDAGMNAGVIDAGVIDAGVDAGVIDAGDVDAGDVGR